MIAKKYSIQVDDQVLDDLRSRLKTVRYPDTIDDTDWQYGVSFDVLKGYINYWCDGFDWRKQEAMLNQWDHYVVSIDGIDLHYVLQESQYSNAIPIVLMHGWPSSFMQMLKLAKQLRALATPELSFHVVIPSLPGYGFSSKPKCAGFGTRKMASTINTLMTEVLGFKRYAIRAGDIGKLVADWLCSDYAQHIIGAHLAEIIMPGPMAVPEDASAEERDYYQKNNLLWQNDMSYCMQHMSKPQTLAVSLNDSPAGLLAWMLEKFYAWSGELENLSDRIDRDELLSNVTLYWVTQTIHSSMRVYFEFCREDFSRLNRHQVPVAFCQGARDLFPHAPEDLAKKLYQVVQSTVCETGGHFLEWESAEFVAADIKYFLQNVNPIIKKRK